MIYLLLNSILAFLIHTIHLIHNEASTFYEYVVSNQVYNLISVLMTNACVHWNLF